MNERQLNHRILRQRLMATRAILRMRLRMFIELRTRLYA